MINIRPTTPQDIPSLVAMLDRPDGYLLSQPEKVADMLSKGPTLTAEVDGAPRGLAFIEAGKTAGQVMVYVQPEFRRQGLGQQLWQAGLAELRPHNLPRAWAFYRSDIGDAGDFYAKRGLELYYGYHLMRYDGPAFPEPSIDARPYVDAYFDAYYAASQAAFQRIFHTLQLAPPDEAARQRERQNYLNPEQKNFAFFNNDELVGGALIVDGYLLDDVFVAPRWHGCGFGTQIVHYVTNRILEQSPRAELAVLTDNTGAERLYRRLGYQRVKTMEIMRTPLGAAF